MSETPTPEQLGALASAVGKVMLAAGAVKKTGKNKHGGYSYASDADLAYALQPAMASNGLVLFPHKQDVRPSEATGGSKMRYRVLTITTWRLIHSGGGWVELQTVGEGADALDKAAYKAQTGALKYALRQLFLVPTGDDPERDQRNKTPEPEPEKAYLWSDADRLWFNANLKRLNVRMDHFSAWIVGAMGNVPLESCTRATLEAILADVESGMLADYRAWLAVRRKQLAEAQATWSDDERSGFCAFLGKQGIKYNDLKAYCIHNLKAKPSSASREYRKGIAKALQNGGRVKFDAWLSARDVTTAKPSALDELRRRVKVLAEKLGDKLTGELAGSAGLDLAVELLDDVTDEKALGNLLKALEYAAKGAE